MNLKTNYLGLVLPNPIIVASSPWTVSLEKLMQMEAAGAGAVVLKSIFEEQILGETDFLNAYNDYPEAADYLKGYVGTDYIKSHLNLIRDAKKHLKIPVIGSINCKSGGTWMEYAQRMEDAGADAIELNIFILPEYIEQTAAELERKYLDIVAEVAAEVKIPVSVKLAFTFTNIHNLCREIYYRNGRGVVLFNRFIEPDVDVEKFTLTSFGALSERSELRNTLRTVGLLTPQLPLLDVAVTTGIHTGEDAVKAILVGAKAVEVCTTLYTNGPEVMRQMQDYMLDWMQRHSFGEVSEFCGILSDPDHKEEELFRRAQFMKTFPK